VNTSAATAMRLLALISVAAFGQGPPVTMTDATVVQMVQSKTSPDLIIFEISRCTPHFALDPANVEYMLKNGVTEDIIRAMVAKQSGQPIPSVDQAPVPPTTQPPQPAVGSTDNKPRVFMSSASKGNTWNAHRDQSMELSKDFERDCPQVKITLNQQNADYNIALNHIEVGAFYRDNQFQIADRNGDLLAHTKEGGSIRKGAKRACVLILDDWARHGH